MTEMLNRFRYLVVVGNYGSGKTEISLNLALQYAQRQETTIVDLDIVNPYFRTGEKASMLAEAGIRVLMPTYALTTVDIPALPAEIQSVFESTADKIIFDVGGDDTGAAALGRYYPSFVKNRSDTAAALVINCMRPLTRDTDDIVDLVRRIENRGRLHIDILINNTNLADKTTPAMIEEGEKTVLHCADILQIRDVLNTGLKEFLDKSSLRSPCLCIQRFMVPEWMEEQS